MPAKRTRPTPAQDPDAFRGLSDHGRRELVAEAFHTFGEANARWLADHLDVAFEDCAEPVERRGRRLN